MADAPSNFKSAAKLSSTIATICGNNKKGNRSRLFFDRQTDAHWQQTGRRPGRSFPPITTPSVLFYSLSHAYLFFLQAHLHYCMVNFQSQPFVAPCVCSDRSCSCIEYLSYIPRDFFSVPRLQLLHQSDIISDNMLCCVPLLKHHHICRNVRKTLVNISLSCIYLAHWAHVEG